MKPQYLTDLQIAKIDAFVQDEVMFEAVRKVLLAGIYSHGTLQHGQTHDPLINGAFSLASLSPKNPIPDEILGQQLRAQWAGINALKNAIDELKTIKPKGKEIESPYNEAI